MSTEVQTEGAIAGSGADVAALSWVRRVPAGVWISLLLVGTLLKGVGWVFLLFPLDAPDEPSHFNHVMQIHTNHALPAINLLAPNYMGPPSTPQDKETRDFLDSYGFNSFRAMPYESSQPPLYYLTAAVFLAPLTEDRLALMYAARLVSVLFGLGSVLALWLGVRLLWPDVPLVQWSAPLVLTLSPQFTFVTSSITNDAAVLLFGTVLFVVWAGGLRGAAGDGKVSVWKWGLLAGVVTALGLLSKLTMAVTIPGTALWLWWLGSGREVALARRVVGFVVGGVASAVAVVAGFGWWIARNYSLYGEPTGSRSVFNIYHKIYFTRRGFPLSQLFSYFPMTFDGDGRGGFFIVTFMSAWASFGWTTVFIPWWAYVAIGLFCLAALVGLVRIWKAGFQMPLPALSVARRRIAGLSVIAALGGFLMLFAYNSLVDYQPQGRYFFVMLAPLLVLLVAGLRRVTPRPKVNNALVWALIAIMVALQLLSVQALIEHVSQG